MTRQLPTLRPRQVIRALERAGFELLRVKGSHHYFHHPGHPELVPRILIGWETNVSPYTPLPFRGLSRHAIELTAPRQRAS